MVIKCNNGHWYDSNVDLVCPHCKRENGKLAMRLDDKEEDDKTVSFIDVAEDMQGLDQQIAGSLSGGNSGSGDVVDDFDFGMEDIDIDDSDKTIALGFFGVSEEIQPVTGWLVCTRGEEKGKDYRLHSGKNFIGRSAKMDVVLLKDNQIAREKHASIVYDPKGHGFYISPEEANLVYHNDQLLAKVRELKENDKIRVGETELVFVPYCKEERRWQEE